MKEKDYCDGPKGLLLQTLRTAINDYFLPYTKGKKLSSYERLEHENAERWLYGRVINPRLSFYNVCENLDLDPEWVHLRIEQRLEELIENQQEPRNGKKVAASSYQQDL